MGVIKQKCRGYTELGQKSRGGGVKEDQKIRGCYMYKNTKIQGDWGKNVGGLAK